MCGVASAMTPRGQTWTSHCEQLVQSIFIMFYRREYGTTACHRFSAVPSVLYHKEPCLHSQSPPHPFHLGFAAFHIMLGWSLIFLRFAYAHRRNALICLLLAERHPSPKQVIIYCEAFPGSAVSSLGRVLAPVTRLHRNDMISKAFQAYIIPIIQR